MRLKNEVTVGLVVLAGILFLVVGAYWLSGKPFGEAQLDRQAVFREVGETRVGSPVKYRGVEVGRVSSIELAGEGEGVLVGFQIDPNVDFPADPAMVLSSASLFGDWQAALVSRSSPQFSELEFTTMPGENVLPGATLPDITQLTAVGARIADDIETLSYRVQLAFTEETALDIRATIENVEEMSEQMTGFIEQQTATYAGVSRNVLEATQNIASATQTVTRVAGQVETEVPAIVANARSASQNLEELSVRLQNATQGVPAMIARADTTLTNFGRLAATADTVLKTIQPQMQELGPTFAQARLAMASLQTTLQGLQNGDGTLGRLINDPALYEEMQAAIATLRRMMNDVQANPGRYVGELKFF